MNDDDDDDDDQKDVYSSNEDFLQSTMMRIIKRRRRRLGIYLANKFTAIFCRQFWLHLTLYYREKEMKQKDARANGYKSVKN